MIEGRAEILENAPKGPGVFRILLHLPALARNAAPGQFVMARVSDGLDPLLRRPFSIHDVFPDGSFALLYKVVGRGTEILSEKRAGELLDVLGPLGKGFGLSDQKGLVCIVGGGIGAAPLVFLARALARKGISGRVLLGGRTGSDVLCADVFSSLGFETRIATDDGSQGCCGFVTGLLEDDLTSPNPPEKVFGCGPHAMLEAVARICLSNKVPCEISLESVMACGMGACLGCALPRPEGGHFHVCADGPVMDASKLAPIRPVA